MQNPDEIEEDIPLSPVLSRNKLDRKLLRARRKKSKSCVNLDTKFASVSEPKSASINDTFTSSQLLNIFDGFEENASVIKAPSSSKKPILPASYSFEDLKGEFKTAAGASIHMSQDAIQATMTLFGDILNPLEPQLERTRKHSFLSKRGTISKDTQSLQGFNKNLYNEKKSGYPPVSLELNDKPKCSKSGRFKGFHHIEIEQNRIMNEKFLLFVRQYYATYNTAVEQLNRKNLSFKSAPEQTINSSTKTLIKANSKDNFKFSLTENKSFFEDFSKSDNKEGLKIGFQTASGKSFHISAAALKKAKHLMQDFQDQLDCKMEIVENEKKIALQNDQKFQFKANELSNRKKADYEKFGAINQHKTSDKISIEFASASGKILIPSKKAIQKAQKLLNNDFNEISNENSNRGLPQTNHIRDEKNYFDAAQGFKSAAGKSINLSENGLRHSRKMLEYLDSCKTNTIPEPSNLAENIISGGFQSASGKSFNASESSLKKAQELLQEVEEDFNISAKTVFDDIDEDLLKNSTILEEIEANSFAKNTSLEDSINQISDKTLKQTNNSSTISRISRKKRLGMSYSKQLQISKDNLEKAKHLVNDVKTLTPQKKVFDNVFNSTPLKEGICLKPDADITPIKHIFPKPLNATIYTGSTIIIGNIDACRDLKSEIEKLQEKTKMLSRRLEALNAQQRILSSNMKEHVRSREGFLYTKKRSTNRISLKNGLILNTYSNQLSYTITPQNAELVHFDYTNENVSYILTQDGALVVPNIDNIIGIFEIERAFKVLSDVQCNLIPEGWIYNHYKWIIWKLASYQKFADNLQGCLSVENVMQQLKYRYDREIDKAERSTLRKIFEKDDAPQKRMILCVSNVFSLPQTDFELELTDGWYSIRTSIDGPLSYQVRNKKIQIGTKLIISGAELINCEGYHPLEASTQVRLKISCNSTRRAAWYAKLGYQKCSLSFPLKIKSCYSEGGPIGCVRIYVARVHPIKYKEKLNTLIVWRNQKAEDIRAQEWKAKRFQETEYARELAMKEHQKKEEEKQKKQINLSIKEIKNVDCPETLYNLMQQSRDPESLVESLSLEQKNTLLDYQQYLSSKTQQEINELIIDKIKKLHFSKRDVTSVLQLRVVDVLDPNKLTSTLQIWKPTESHFDILKEGLVFDVFNIFRNKNGDLSSMNRTKFKAAPNTFEDFGEYRRELLSISMISSLKRPIYFNEFDTVGIIVEMNINDVTQKLWLSDLNKCLLFIQIFDGPKNCLLLENLKPGQVVSVCNLILVTSYANFAKATANHSTIFSKSSQYRHLQEGMDNFSQHIPKDIQPFLDDCIAKIQICDLQSNITTDGNRSTTSSIGTYQGSAIYDESCDETDVLMSMMDIDKYS